MQERILHLLILASKRTRLRLLLPLAILGAIGIVGLMASLLVAMPDDARILLQAVSAFIAISAFLLMVYVRSQLGKRLYMVSQLGRQPALLKRVHFEPLDSKATGRRFRVLLHLQSGRIYFVLPEAQFMEVQAYMVAHFPDITPTTLLRKLARKQAPVAPEAPATAS
jgi:hypothetical protein